MDILQAQVKCLLLGGSSASAFAPIIMELSRHNQTSWRTQDIRGHASAEAPQCKQQLNISLPNATIHALQPLQILGLPTTYTNARVVFLDHTVICRNLDELLQEI